MSSRGMSSGRPPLLLRETRRGRDGEWEWGI